MWVATPYIIYLTKGFSVLNEPVINFTFFPFQVRGQARQRVRPAVQLLSNSVATAAERFCGRSEEAEFIRVLDRGLDALNAHNPT